MRRIPEVPRLSSFLPEGAEGGKEFARILNLLLFREAIRKDYNFQSLNDVSGDFGGLDSYLIKGDGTGVLGYQYKFFQSPFDDQQRNQIRVSLLEAYRKRDKTDLKKWVLITPDNLIESGRRSGGGDVEWFKSLKVKLRLDDIEIEHWGHIQITEMMMQTPHICLFYYPELVPEISSLRKPLEEVKRRYFTNLLSTYGKINFVGMSVYKEEATNGIPMENIYIPLTLLPAGYKSAELSGRINPLIVLTPGKNSVILGDPGSGKSTLSRFLALVGRHEELQKRVGAGADDRLTIHVTLKRYSDALGSELNLPLLNYVAAHAQSDLSLPDADITFFQSYLETGKSVIILDGLDEVKSEFKEIIRDRIQCFVDSFPGNSVVITARVVGYSDCRLDQRFSHYQVGELRVPEIDQFVQDWYSVRIDNRKERNANVDDLIRVINDPDNKAIRDLARNPLLLAIIALVHRLDATLPDERVVLYDKCTETLLNTWHKRKFKTAQASSVTKKIDRQNRARMEALGLWMQQQGTTAGERTIAPYGQIKAFLSGYITRVENPQRYDADAEDIAEEFLEFVKERAGLMIAVGEKDYSFIHLTFQEYLAACCLERKSQAVGVAGLWDTVAPLCSDLKWHEVLRLLAAQFAFDAQDMFIHQLLQFHEESGNGEALKLLAGTLVDGVQVAEDNSALILSRIVHCALGAPSEDDYGWAVRSIRDWSHKDGRNAAELKGVMLDIASSTAGVELLLQLLWLAVGHSLSEITELVTDSDPSMQQSLISYLFLNIENADVPPELEAAVDLLIPFRNRIIATSHQGNVLGSAVTMLLAALNPRKAPQYFLSASLSIIQRSSAYADGFWDWSRHAYLLTCGDDPAGVWQQRRPRNSELQVPKWYRTLAKALPASQNASVNARVHDGVRISKDEYRPRSEQNWKRICSDPSVRDRLVLDLCQSIGLEPLVPWCATMQNAFLPSVPQRLLTVGLSEVDALIERWRTSTTTESDHYLTAWYILLDLWLMSIDPRIAVCKSPTLLNYALSSINQGVKLIAKVAVGQGITEPFSDSTIEPLLFSLQSPRRLATPRSVGSVEAQRLHEPDNRASSTEPSDDH